MDLKIKQKVLKNKLLLNKIKRNLNLQQFHSDFQIRAAIYNRASQIAEQLIQQTKYNTKKRKIVNSICDIGLTEEDLVPFYIDLYYDFLKKKNHKQRISYDFSERSFEDTLKLIFEDISGKIPGKTRDKKFAHTIKNLTTYKYATFVFHLKNHVT